MSVVIDSLLAPSALSVVFQPIFELTDLTVRGAEALTRGPKGSHFEPAPVLFDYFRLKREEVRIDRCCVAMAIAGANLTAAPLLFVNIHAATLERDPLFSAFLAKTCRDLDFDPARLVVELVEQSTFWQVARLQDALKRLRDIGAAIALDDVGVGYCNLRMILEVQPDYVKIDRFFIDGCARDTQRQAVLRSVATLGREFGAAIIAEGIETAEELDFVREAGIPFAQGFFLARPVENPALICSPEDEDRQEGASVCL